MQVAHYLSICLQITVKANRKGMPLINKKLKTGDIQSRASKSRLAIKWHNKKDKYYDIIYKAPQRIGAF